MKTWVLGVGILVILAILVLPAMAAPDEVKLVKSFKDEAKAKQFKSYQATYVTSDGKLMDKYVMDAKPPAVKMPAASVPVPNPAAGINILTEIPAYHWSRGCSATSAAMLFGYYDRTGYKNIYAGPAECGIAPMDNFIAWGTDDDCPLSATRQGFDGLTTRGHVDDYYFQYLSNVDPYFGNWAEHGYADCTADYMGTNQFHNWQNSDGSTSFWWWTNGDPMYDRADCADCDNGGPSRDGNHGMKLFAESRGYSVAASGNFNQYWDGDPAPNGFTFAQYKAEIDAGRPVLIQIDGHTMIGFGYDDTGNTLYIHDTWDHADHTMTWGSSYGGMAFVGVSVFRLNAVTNSPPVAEAGGPYSAPQGSTITVTGAGSTDPDGDALRYMWDRESEGTWDSGCTDTPTYSMDACTFGTITTTLQVSDGSVTSTDTAQVEWTNVAPSINAIANSNTMEGSPFTASVSFTDPGCDFWSARVDYGDGTGWHNLGSVGKTFSVSRSYCDNGDYTVAVEVTDNGGAMDSETFDVHVENVAPEIAPIPDQTPQQGSSFSVTGSFTDPGCDDAWTARVNYDDGTGYHDLALDGKSFTLSQSYCEAGDRTVTVEVTDKEGAIDTEDFIVHVTNAPPVLDPIEDQTTNEGSPVTVTVSFTDPGCEDTWTARVDYGDTTGWHDLGLVGMTFPVTCTYCDNGEYTVTVEVTDNGGLSDTETFVVRAGNVAPTVSIDGMDQPNAQFILPVVHTLTFHGSFVDPGCDSWTLTWDFGDGTPAVTGTLDPSHVYGAPGIYPVTFTVTDDDGGSGSAAMTVTVASVQEDLALYIQSLDPAAFKGDAEQRKAVLANKFVALDRMLDKGDWKGFINSIQGDIRNKADGTVGGKENDDWITNPAFQREICMKIDDIVAYVKTFL